MLPRLTVALLPLSYCYITTWLRLLFYYSCYRYIATLFHDYSMTLHITDCLGMKL